MSLPKPVLDSRTFAQLVSEGTAQISRLAPAWTNYNAADPGITLLELFAWLSEQNLYRTDRVTDEMTRAFLRLVDISPESAGVASTVVLLAAPAAIELPERTQLGNASPAPLFETRDPVTISPAVLVRVLAANGSSLVDVVASDSFFPFGASPCCGAALYLGFDRPLGIDGTRISLYVWTTTSARDVGTRAALVREFAERHADARRHCPPDVAAHAGDWRLNDEVRTIWEYLAFGATWQPLPDVDDETRALTLSGFVRFTVPAGQQPGGPSTDWFVRCRLVCGTFTCPAQLERIGVNAVTAEDAVGVEDEPLGTSAGHSFERYATALVPVVAGTTRLRLANGTDYDTSWTEVLDWDLVGPHDRRYRLDPLLGEITTGNGMRGDVFPAESKVTVSYRVGGGTAGNIAASTLTTLAPTAWNATHVPGGVAVASSIAVVQPIAALGGALAEPLPAAEARAIGALAVPTRTITLADIVTLACSVPGTDVARAAAVPLMHPAVPCFTAAANVTVVVVPNCDGPAPMPTRGFLHAVARYLDRRRPVTTELHVVAPTYVTVTVSATVRTTPNSDTSVLPALGQTALDAFFNPLSGGPDGDGWPIGRAVYRTEVMALLAALPGVASVTDLTLQANDETPVCGNVDLCAVDLVRSGRHAINAVAISTAVFARSTKRECI